MRLILLVIGAVLAAGCSHEEVRSPDPDAGGSIVNPRAPGAQHPANGAPATQEFTAPPGMKTGIPK